MHPTIHTLLPYNISVVDQPVARLEPADRENFFLKFGYDDALVKENQDRGDYP